MGCLSRILVVGALLVQVIASGLALLVLGSAGVLGSAAIINSDDAFLVFIAVALSLLATVVLAVKIWIGSRRRKHMERELAELRARSIAGGRATTESLRS